MATVFFYNFILLSSTFFVWLSEKGRTKLDRWVLLGIAFLLVFMPAAIRYDIGVDYLNYLAIYEDNFRVPLEDYKFKEPAFYFLNWLLKSFDAHFQWLFVVFSFVFTAISFMAYPRKNPWLIHFLFFSMQWFFSFNGMRQAIASSWCLLAMFHYIDKRYYWFIFLTLIASLFHQSAIIITAVGVFSLVPLNDRIKTYIAPMFFVSMIVFTYFFVNVVLIYMEQLLNIIRFTHYSSYFGSSKFFAANDLGTGLGVLAKVIYSIYLILHTRALIKVNSNYWFVIVLVFIYAVSVVLAGNIIIFKRLVDGLLIAPVLGSLILTEVTKNKKRHLLVLLFFLLLMLLSFIKASFGVENSYADPKLNPYQTIFNY